MRERAACRGGKDGLRHGAAEAVLALHADATGSPPAEALADAGYELVGPVPTPPHIGVHAMQAFNPPVPHTRAGLRPMRVITMDDVTLDAFCWYPGEKEPRRPVGLGLMDVLTANIVSWCLVPVRQRADGTKAKLDGLTRRYADAAVFCHIGIDALEGLVMLLEHGTAGMDADEEARINGILGPQPDGGPWLTVQCSSTSGAPLTRGLFRERGRGRPTHKANPREALLGLGHREQRRRYLHRPRRQHRHCAACGVLPAARMRRSVEKACERVPGQEPPGNGQQTAHVRDHVLPGHRPRP